MRLVNLEKKVGNRTEEDKRKVQDLSWGSVDKNHQAKVTPGKGGGPKRLYAHIHPLVEFMERRSDEISFQTTL